MLFCSIFAQLSPLLFSLNLQVFDCRLHGCSQDLVFPVSRFYYSLLNVYMICLPDSNIFLVKYSQAEKQPLWYHLDEGNVPCGPHCYRSVCAGCFIDMIYVAWVVFLKNRKTVY